MNIKNAKSVGFVIANSDQEFLAHFQYKPGYVLKAWSLTPEHAHIFSSRQLAKNCLRLLDHYERLYVLDLFETENQLIVLAEKKTGPHWLHASA